MGLADARWSRSPFHMPDPTEFVIIATFSTAFGIFALAAIARLLMGKASVSLPAIHSAAPDDGSPYQSPRATTPPPPLPVGRVPVWFYGPLDLLGIGFVFATFFGLVVASVKSSPKAEAPLDPNGLITSIAFQFVIAGIVTAFVIGRIRPIEWLGLRWPGWRWSILIAPVSVLLMWLFFSGLQVSGFMQWIESLGVETVQDTVKILQQSNNPAVLGLMAFAAVIAAPFCEEIVFRGYLYSATKRFAGPWAAGICSALVFAAAHGSLAALLPLFVFGCVLVFVYEKTGSLWAPIAVHFCFNGATVVIQMAARFYHIPLDVSP